tara:strand:- start:1670 stop:2338 length:669 start_codon:yes stop_codon:yes gene_type:complete
MKYLVTICGKWSDDFQLEFQSFIKYIPFDLEDCNIIVISDKEQSVEWLKCNNLIQKLVINDSDNDKLFSYKCLEYANFEKEKFEINNLTERFPIPNDVLLYDLCFFIDSNDFHKINFPSKQFILPHDREIVTFNSKRLEMCGHITDTGEDWTHSGEKWFITVCSTSFWYCDSMVFNHISKYYKGNHYLNNFKKWKSIFGYVNEEITFFNYIRKIGFGFNYAS